MASLLTEAPSPSAFTLVGTSAACPCYADPDDAAVVHEALAMLVDDIQRCSGQRPLIQETLPVRAPCLLIAGTLDGSATIARLRADGLLPRADRIAGGWEQFDIVIVEKPFPGIDRALVVVGSDRRGCAYGLLEMSRQLGVSPWCWWADVPHPRHDQVHVRGLDEPSREPAVRYRGIFINDEHFRFAPWAKKQIDADVQDIGPKTYRLVFQLMLRLRCNYLWPAIASSAFAFQGDNDRMADRFAVVLGGHHASSMLRSKHEWWRQHGRKDTTFNYQTHPEKVRAFWDERLQQTKRLEAIYPIGMRGLGDIPADIAGGLDARRDLIATVIADQRRMLAEAHDRPADTIPQVFTVWKEAEELMAEGLQLPDDVILLRSNDSYGWLLPMGGAHERQRSGGLGMYFHLSYMGRPNEYLQLCSTPPAQIWHQLHAALAFGHDRMWVINVGDIKPAEYALSYAMDLAWHGQAFDVDSPERHLQDFFVQAFGASCGARAAELYREYLRLAAHRRPEHVGGKRLEPARAALDVRFSLYHEDETERRIAAYAELEQRAQALAAELAPEQQDAWYQLVGFPIGYAAHLNHKHLHAHRQRWLAHLGCRPAAAQAAAQAEAAYRGLDEELYPRYQQLAGGKWRHFMDIHQVEDNYGPPLLADVAITSAEAVLVVQGCAPARDGQRGLELPVFHPLLRHDAVMDCYATDAACRWRAESEEPWIRISPAEGTLTDRQRIHVAIDWQQLPSAGASGHVRVRCGREQWRVAVHAEGLARWRDVQAPCFVEAAGRVSIQAAHFQRQQSRHGVSWLTLPGLGHHDAVVTPMPISAQPRLPDYVYGDLHDSACLEYDIHLADAGIVEVMVAALPTQPLCPNRNAAYAMGFDDQSPARVDIRTSNLDEVWQENVQRGLSITRSRHRLETGGHHVLKLWMSDTNIAIDGIVIDCGGGWPGYLQPAETLIS